MGDEALRIQVRPAPAAPLAGPPQIEVRARPAVVDSCRYCHDAIGERAEVALCPRCQTTLHGECRAAIDRCPTIGCDGITDRPADRLLRSPEAELERGDFTRLGGLVVGPSLGALLLPALFLLTMGGPAPGSAWDLVSPLLYLGVMGAMVGVMLGAAVGLVVDLVGVRSRAVTGARLLVPLLVVLLAAAGAFVGQGPASAVLLATCWGSIGVVVGLRAFGSPLR